MKKHINENNPRLCKVCGKLKEWSEFRPNGDNRTPMRICKDCPRNATSGVLMVLDHYELQTYEKFIIEEGIPPFDISLIQRGVNQACLTCGNIKVFDDFRIRKGKDNKPDYVVHNCKVCEATYTSEYRKKNPEKVKEYTDYYVKSGKSRDSKINLALKNLQKHLWKQAKNNAKNRNKDFNLDIEDIIIPDVCPYLEIPLKFNVSGSRTSNSDSYSIDRIDVDKGYVKGNVQIISWLANTMKNAATIEQLITFANNVVKIHNKQDEDIV